MAEDNLTVAILREIRDEVRGNSARIDALDESLNARFDSVDTRFDGVDARFEATDARLEVIEHTLKDLAGQQVMLTRYVKNSIDRHDTAIEDLDERVTRVETKLES